jgi:hypothetical protein
MTDDESPGDIGVCSTRPGRQSLDLRRYSLEAAPGTDGRYAYVKTGLSYRKLEEGRWQVRRSDGKPLHQVAIQVAIKEPWASDVGSCVFAGCATHGESCHADGGDCQVVYQVGTTKRWAPAVEVTSPYIFEVRLWEIPTLSSVQKTQEELIGAREWVAANTRLAGGAGFAVVLTSEL